MMVALQALTVMIGLVRRGEPLLLKEATLITNVNDWAEGQLTVGDYTWISPTQIVAFTGENKEKVLDIATKSWSSINASALRPGSYSFMSPDLTKVIDEEWKEKKATFRVTDFSGHLLSTWSIATPYKRQGRHIPLDEVASRAQYWVFPQWSANSREIYQIETWWDNEAYRVRVLERDAAHPTTVRQHEVSAVAWVDGLEVFDGKVTLDTGNRDTPEGWKLGEYKLDDPNPTVTTWRVLPPKNYVFETCHFSPDHQKVLWECTGPSDFGKVSLWVSERHGKGMKEIGVLDFSRKGPRGERGNFQNFGEVKWNPDGKHVSFVYSRKLYLAKV
jgi:hypothetical protein